MSRRVETTTQRSDFKVDSGPANTLAAARRGLHAAEVDLRNAVAHEGDPRAARALVLVQLAALRLDGSPGQIAAAA